MAMYSGSKFIPTLVRRWVPNWGTLSNPAVASTVRVSTSMMLTLPGGSGVVEDDDAGLAAVGWRGLYRQRRQSVVDRHAVDQAIPGDVDVLDKFAGLHVQHVDTDHAGHPDGVGPAVECGDFRELARSG